MIRRQSMSCSNPIIVITFFCIIILLSCTGGDPIPPSPPSDLSGSWSGTWSGTDPVFGPVSGNWEAEINKYGYRFTASARLSGDVDCPDGTIAGAVGHNNLVSGTITREPCQQNEWTLTAFNKLDRSAAGTWTQAGSGAQGTFTGSLIATSSGPRIAYFNPPGGSTDTVVTIVGMRFGPTTTVDFNAVPATEYLTAPDPSTTIVTRVPVGTTLGAIVITTPSGTALSPVPFNGNVTSPVPFKSYTISVPTGPEGVAFSPDGRRAFVSNKGSGNVSMINTYTNQVLLSTPIDNAVAVPVEGVVVSPDGRKVYVACGDRGIKVLDAVTNNIIDTIAVNAGGGPSPNPQEIALSPDGRLLFVSDNHDGGAVTVLDASSKQFITAVPGGAGIVPLGIAVTPDGREAYMVFSGSNEIKVFDIQSGVVTASIAAGSSPVGIAMSPDGTAAWVTSGSDDSVSVIDISTRQTATVIPVGSSPAGIAISPDGKRAFIANRASNSISVVDIVSHQTVSIITVGSAPTGIAISSDGRQAYVTNSLDNSVNELGGPVTLSIMKKGSGIGTVTSSPNGIICGTNCQGRYLTGDVITLSAVAGDGSTFTGWSGDPDCLDGIVTMGANKLCYANFELNHCFIATAAYGSDMAPEVQVLRDFRNKHLFTNPVGRLLVDFYYKVSPTLADYLKEHQGLRWATRQALSPVIYILKHQELSLFFIFGIVVALFSYRRITRRPNRLGS